jgi:acylphosphatase
MMKRLEITVTGRVQGVGFRYFTEDVANSLGLSGWVRNNPDRTVECEAQGEEDVLKEFCTELRKGPPLSRVKDLLVTEVPLVEGQSFGFEIAH